MNHWRRIIAPISLVVFAPGSGYTTQYLTVEEAQRISFAEASSFQEAHLLFKPEQISQIEELIGKEISVKGQQLWKALKGDQLLGYFVIDYVIGKHLTIDYAIALNPDFTVKQIEILQYREEYGDEIKDPNWLRQFVGKDKNSPLKMDEDIKNISGATFSSTHITEGIKRVLITLSTIKP